MEPITIISFILGVAVGGIIMNYICNQISESAPFLEKMISNSEAITLMNNRVRPAGESVSGHISLNVLLSYVDNISKTSKKNSTTLSGFEFYFARYGSNKETEEAKVSNKMTFFLYPTVDIDGDHVPYDPVASRRGNIVKFIDIMESGNNGDNKVALNKSHMSPPRGFTFL